MLVFERSHHAEALEAEQNASSDELAQGTRNKRRRPDQSSDNSDDVDDESNPNKRRYVNPVLAAKISSSEHVGGPVSPVS
jgi:hypothetical protein